MSVDKIKKASFIFMVALLIVISAINIFSPKVESISKREKRQLKTFPEFSIKTLFNGEYFNGIEEWFSDNFILRDEILDADARIKKYLLLDTYFEMENNIVYISARRDDENFDIDSEKKQDLDYTNTDKENANDENFKNDKEKVNNGEQNVSAKKNLREAVKNEDYIYDDGFAGGSEIVGKEYILYNDAIYSDTSFNLPEATKFLEVLDEYRKAFGGARTSLVIAPASTIMLYGNKNFPYNEFNQDAMVRRLALNAPDDVNVVNPCKRILDHRDEYIYFKYDHHWTNRGAYYAYKELCEDINELAPELTEMEELVLNEAWVGSAYDYTNDIRLYGKTDKVIAYISTRSNVMTVTLDNGETRTDYGGAIRRKFVSYSAFISGDNPFVEINVPSNPQDKCALVIKDSFGCAFVPYLVNNYGNIYVIDPRHTKFNVVNKLKNKNIVDIIAVSTLYNVSSVAFRENVEMLLNAIDE